MSDYAIRCDHVSFQYKIGSPVLNGVSFQVRPGESIGLIGANGVGKSTLLRILTGLEIEFSGEVWMDSLPVAKKNLSQIRKNIGYVFQTSENQLFMQTVYDDVAFAPRNYKMPKAEVDQRVMHALEEIGIENLKDRPIYQLSGGEKKMVAIATILSMTPDIILMDEPSIALDPRNRRKLIQILNHLTQTKLIASHDLDLILDTCERVILMAGGSVIADKPAKEILYNKTLLEDNGLELPLCVSGERGKNYEYKMPPMRRGV